MAREIATGKKKPHVVIKDSSCSLPQYDPQMRYVEAENKENKESPDWNVEIEWTGFSGGRKTIKISQKA